MDKPRAKLNLKVVDLMAATSTEVYASLGSRKLEARYRIMRFATWLLDMRRLQ